MSHRRRNQRANHPTKIPEEKAVTKKNKGMEKNHRKAISPRKLKSQKEMLRMEKGK